MGIFYAFGLLFVSFGNLVQKFKNLVSGNSFNTPFPKIMVKPGEERLV